MIKKIAIIGGGNLGSAIAKGLKNAKKPFEGEIAVTRRRVHLIKSLEQDGIIVGKDNVEATKNADIVVLAVKPYQLKDILDEISPYFLEKTILISLAAGVDSLQISEMAGGRKGIFRVMPNTAISIGESMTCVSAFQSTEEQDQIINGLFEPVGVVQFIPEELMASATVLAACGIAYALRFIRAATQGGVEIGFGSELALRIASQTVKGAAELIIQDKSHPEAEIDKVTTPRGITISGLNEMEHQGFSSALIKGVLTSFEKIENAGKKK
ncbi:pyrroline-5-carboxylate reductase [Marinilabilia rubra]|uniref:Pyrroline-5-carboxylate reductase n=1 Tax=Marinilabilia rubra TaxID=2162893 RepID=A0A2U2BDQ2_9BACT|nr:pyrroline-5-carboxylate reductase [Marinilabilia rubra]PWE01189.1 pyrroline-5-carboxylate reductase [Marinilabilia rubra]